MDSVAAPLEILVSTLRDVAPIVLVLTVFQVFVLRRPLPNSKRFVVVDVIFRTRNPRLGWVGRVVAPTTIINIPITMERWTAWLPPSSVLQTPGKTS